MPVWARFVTAVAALRVAAALVLYLSGQVSRGVTPPLPFEAYAFLAGVFGVLGVTLAAGNRHDVRATWLGGIFVLVAAPLCTPFLMGRSLGDFGWLIFVRMDAFLPVFLWAFVAEFPSPLVGQSGARARRARQVVTALSVLAAGVNLSFLFLPPDDAASDWRTLLRPIAGAGSLYYPVVFGAGAATFPMLVWRAHGTHDDERRRVRLFVGALVAGCAPLAAQAMLESIPQYYAFIHRPVVELAVGIVIFAALAAVPFVTAYSVLFDHVVELRVVLRAALQYGLARYSIFAVTTVPFLALALLVFRHRSEPIVSLLAGPRSQVLGAMAVAGIMALRLRHSWLGAVDRRYFREPYDTRQLLDRMMNDASRAVDVEALEAHLCEALQRAFHTDAALFVADEESRLLRRPNGADPLRMDGILASLTAGDPMPMDVDPNDQRSPFKRLPPDEQRWVLAGRVRLLVALRAPADRMLGLLALSSKRSGLAYSMEDRRLLTAVSASVALVLDNLRLRASADSSSSEAALECQTCSRLNGPDATVCACGGPVSACGAPQSLRGVYRLDRRIGAGGMGVVYHARDVDLDRSVAIKTLPRMSPEHAASLRREARAMASVAHPNLAVIYGIETWRGIPFLVQEYLDGGTLADRLASARLSMAEALDLGITLAGALAYLHDLGIIHRDVKPSNIGFTHAGVVKLLDFGVARLVGPASPPMAESTVTRAVATESADQRSEPTFVGTPAYMAPEALNGEPPQASFDLWSLAVVLYQSLTGRRPFEGRTTNQLLASIAAGPVARPSEAIEGCPLEVDAFFRFAFDVHKNRRLREAGPMKAALQQLRAMC